MSAVSFFSAVVIWRTFCWVWGVSEAPSPAGPEGVPSSRRRRARATSLQSVLLLAVTCLAFSHSAASPGPGTVPFLAGPLRWLRTSLRRAALLRLLASNAAMRCSRWSFRWSAARTRAVDQVIPWLSSASSRSRSNAWRTATQ